MLFGRCILAYLCVFLALMIHILMFERKLVDRCSLRLRCLKHWLTGKQTTEVFIDHLPGAPDNINLAADGTFWIALLEVYSCISYALLYLYGCMHKTEV